MEDGDTEKYHPSRVIQDFVFLSQIRGCIRCISLQVYNNGNYYSFQFSFDKLKCCIKTHRFADIG